MSAVPSYKTNDPKGWCGDPKRGAALGRATIRKAHHDAMVKLYLRRVHLDNGGYDPNGTYFGHGDPLYWCADADGEVDFMLRANSRSEAKLTVLNKYPKARFFR